MPKILSMCHAVLTLVLLGVVIFLLQRHDGTRHSPDVIQAHRVEVIDRNGKVTAALDGDREEAPAMVLLDKDGHEALLMTVNSLGYAAAYFNSKRTEGKVSVGYLWGSDSLPENTEDPLARWGIRVRGMNGTVKDLSLPENSPPTEQ